MLPKISYQIDFLILQLVSDMELSFISLKICLFSTILCIYHFKKELNFDLAYRV